jgi:hypothetical protein
MTNRPAPFPFDELHAAAPDAAEHIDALRTELERDRPDPRLITSHVTTLRGHGHGGLLGAIEGWYLDARTQAFIAELNGLGL